MSAEPRRRGRPPHRPSDDTRALVRDMVGQGRSIDDIALAVGVSEPTLRLHYAGELAAPRPQITFPFADAPAEPQAPRERAGRPPHVPTEATRERVEILIAGGMTTWQIAAALGVSEPTLRFHYPDELQNGRARKTAGVLEALFRAGVAEGNVSALKAWLGRPQSLDDPPPVPPPAREEPIGKKEAQQRAALAAGTGTDWERLLPN